jgi:dolichol-phosphate mannosyltransferase
MPQYGGTQMFSVDPDNRVSEFSIDRSELGDVYARSCVVIPSLNEPASLVASLIAEVQSHVPGVWVVVVDDSPPDYAGSFAATIENSLASVAVVQRHADPAAGGGLGGAVMEGLRRAQYRGRDFAVVMDSDGQHPPDELPRMLALLGCGAGYDAVIASRYRAGGSAGNGLSAWRRVVSRGSGAMAHAAFPVAIGSCTDPMSGFFAVRLAAIDVDSWASGFKVLLQILAQHPRMRRAEIGFQFAERRDGTSKAGVAEGIRYVRGLAVLRCKTVRRHRVATVDQTSTGRARPRAAHIPTATEVS